MLPPTPKRLCQPWERGPAGRPPALAACYRRRAGRPSDPRAALGSGGVYGL